MQNVEQNKKIFHVPYKLFTRICQSLYLYICPIHFGSSGYLSIALKLILSNYLEWATPQESESPVKITTPPHPKKWGVFLWRFPLTNIFPRMCNALAPAVIKIKTHDIFWVAAVGRTRALVVMFSVGIGTLPSRASSENQSQERWPLWGWKNVGE